MGNTTDGTWKVGYNRMVVAVSLEGVSAEAARTYGGGRIICKFINPADGELIASAPAMKRELEQLKRRMRNGQNFLLSADNGLESMISVTECLKAFGFIRENKEA